MDNVLDLLDQSAFDLERVTGVGNLVPSAWVYDRGVDIDGLRRIHGHLERGRLTRCIKRSPLRVGRHRWISCEGVSEMEVVGSARV